MTGDTKENKTLIECESARDLAKYFSDTEAVTYLVDWLHVETGISKLKLQIACKLSALVLLKAGGAIGGYLGSATTAKANNWLIKWKLYSQFVEGIDKVKQRLDNSISDKKLVDEILAGKRSPSAAVNAVSIPQDLSACLKILEQQDELKEFLSDELDDIKTILQAQNTPNIELNRPDRSEGIARFHYRSGWVPFVGREKEWADLSAFIQSDKKFCWWLLTGSGGLGKSRLAFEFCQSLNGWKVGFLQKHSTFENWYLWQPSEPTLIVIDYVAARSDGARNAIIDLYNRRQELLAPVRILLLERNTSENWWLKFKGTEIETQGAAMVDCQYSAPYQVSPLGESALVEIMMRVLKQKDKSSCPEPTSLLKILSGVDKESRPLFAVFVADTLVEIGPTSLTTKDQVLKCILSRERTRFWEPAGIRSCDIDLLALVSMTNGLPLSVIDTVDASLGLPSTANAAGKTLRPELLETITGRSITEVPDAQELEYKFQKAAKGMWFHPLSPDILSEFFVLEHLHKMSETDHRRVEAICQVAWSLEPVEFAEFSARTIHDFRNHSFLSVLTEPPKKRTKNSSIGWLYVANAIFTGVDHSDDLCHSTFENLVTIDSRVNDNANAQLLCIPFRNYLVTMCRENKAPRAERAYAEISRIVFQNSDIATARRVWAEASYFMAQAQQRWGNFEAGLKTLQGLSELMLAHKLDSDLCNWWVRCGSNMLVESGRQERFSEAHELINHISQIRTQVPAQPKVLQLWLHASAALALSEIRHKSKSEAVEIMVKVLDEIVSQADESIGEQFMEAVHQLSNIGSEAKAVPE